MFEENAQHNANEGTDDRLPDMIANMCASIMWLVKKSIII